VGLSGGGKKPAHLNGTKLKNHNPKKHPQSSQSRQKGTGTELKSLTGGAQEEGNKVTRVRKPSKCQHKKRKEGKKNTSGLSHTKSAKTYEDHGCEGKRGGNGVISTTLVTSKTGRCG